MRQVARRGGLVAGLVLGLAVLSPAGASPPERPGADPGRREALFREVKGLESESHRERIRILEEAEACLQRAAAPPELRQCERTEREARERLRERLRAKREALRERLRPAGGRE